MSRLLLFCLLLDSSCCSELGAVLQLLGGMVERVPLFRLERNVVCGRTYYIAPNLGVNERAFLTLQTWNADSFDHASWEAAVGVRGRPAPEVPCTGEHDKEKFFENMDRLAESLGKQEPLDNISAAHYSRVLTSSLLGRTGPRSAARLSGGTAATSRRRVRKARRGTTRRTTNGANKNTNDESREPANGSTA